VLGGTIGTFEDLGFGTIEAINGVEINGTLYYGGTINAPVRGHGTIDLLPTGHEYGRTTVLGDATSNSGFDFHGNVHVGTAELILRDANAAVLRGELTLTTHGTNPEIYGRVIAPNGLEVDGSISGSGAINAPITGSGVINATGSLVLGTTSGSSGFDFDGTLNAGGSHVTLLTPGLPARLGVLTAISGGRLESANGFVTDPGDQLVGFGVVQGAFFGGLGSAAMTPTGTLVYTSALLLDLSDTWILSDGDATFAAPISIDGATVRGFGGGLALTANGTLSGHGHLLLPLFTSARPITVAGGTLDLGAGGRLAGTINAPAGTVLQLSGGVTQFQLGVNAQIDRLRLSGGSAIVEASSGFAASKIEVEAGSLTFAPGTTGNLTNTSALTVAGTGTVALETTGSLNLPATTTVTGDGTNRGTLTGSGAWMLPGGSTLELNSGALGGPGTLTIQPNAQMNFLREAQLDRDIINHGLVRFDTSENQNPASVYETARYLHQYGQATLTNAAGGVLQFADLLSQEHNNVVHLHGLTINNAGVLGVAVAPPTELPNYARPWVYMDRDLGNSGAIDLRNDATLIVYGNFSNSGTVTMGDTTSRLVALGGGLQTGTFALGSQRGATVELLGSPVVHDHGATFFGNGGVWVDGGTLHTQPGTYIPTVNMRLGGGVDLPEANAISIGSGRWMNLSGPISSQPITVPDNTLLAISGWSANDGSLRNPITVAAGGQLDLGRIWDGTFSSTQPGNMNWYSLMSASNTIIINRDPDDSAKGVIHNHGLMRLSGQTNLSHLITGTGQVVNHAGATLVNEPGLTGRGGFDMRLETVNHGTLRLVSHDTMHPTDHAEYALTNPIYSGTITNFGNVLFQALEDVFDSWADVWIRLGDYFQEAGQTEILTALHPLPSHFAHAYLQADRIENRGGSMSATGRIVVPTLTNQSLFTVLPEHLWLSGNFLNQSGGTLHLKGRLNLEGSSSLTLGNGSKLILDGPNADVRTNVDNFYAGVSQYGSDFITPTGTTIEIRGGRNISGNTNWTTHGTFQVGAGSTFNRFGGNLGGGGEIRVLSGGTMALGGNGNWSGPAGAITIEGGGTLQLGGHDNGINRFYNRTLTNYGTVQHDASQVGLNSASVVTNHGTWNSQTSAGGFFTHDGQPAGGLFENFGTFNKTGATSLEFGSGSGGPAFTNHGIVNVNQGTFSIHRTSTFTGTSVANIASGATLLLRDGTNNLQDGSRFQGAGTLSLGDAGQHHLNGTIHADNASFWGGTLQGTHTLTGTWNKSGSGGNMGTAGTTTIANGATWNFQASTNLRGRTFVNQGTVNRTDGQLEFSPDTIIQNHGTWNDANQGGSYGSQNSPQGGLFENFGTFNKTATGTLSFASGSGGPAFTNHGIVNVNQGTFSIHRTSTFSGTSVANIASGATLLLRDGTNNLQDGARFQGAGTLSLGDAGQHHLNGTIHADNGWHWGGTLHGTHTLQGNWAVGYGASMATAGTTTIASGATFTFREGGEHRLQNRNFMNHGSVFHTAGQTTLNAASTITNHGTWTDSSGASFVSSGDRVGLIENRGTFIKTGANTLTVDYYNGPVFSNLGTVDVQQGTLQLNRNLAQHSGSTLTGGTWIVRNGATLRDDYTTAYSVNQGDVTLHGTGEFAGFSTVTNNQGALRLLDGKTFSTGAAFTNSGTLIVGTGSSFSTTSTFANSGTLSLLGSFNATGGLTNTGTFGGGGTFTGSLVNAGLLSPGQSPGLLNITGNLTLQSTSHLLMELGGLIEGISYDSIDVTGTLTFGGTLTVTLVNTFIPATGAAFNLFDAGAFSGTFASLNLPTLSGGLQWDTSTLYTAGVLSVSAIPEPSTYAALAGLAALGLAAWKRRIRQG
jgi:hypothetical protein